MTHLPSKVYCERDSYGLHNIDLNPTCTNGTQSFQTSTIVALGIHVPSRTVPTKWRLQRSLRHLSHYSTSPQFFAYSEGSASSDNERVGCAAMQSNPCAPPFFIASPLAAPKLNERTSNQRAACFRALLPKRHARLHGAIASDTTRTRKPGNMQGPVLLAPT